MKYLVIIEKGERSYSAFSPDVPGCVAAGKSVDKTIANMRSALEFHFEGIIDGGEGIPAPRGLNFYLEQTGEISSDDILAHVEIDVPDPVPV